MGWLGLDDTDSLSGGCTTEVFHRLIDDLPEETEVGVPRLVRLWPFAQRRTRGNAALSIELKHDDEKALLNHLEEWWNNHVAPLKGQVEGSTISDREQSPSSPGMVWFKEQPDEAFYWHAVREDASQTPLPEADRSWGEHGCIGATAAVAWREHLVTWEAIAWRREGQQGVRQLDLDALVALDSWPSIVLSRDPRKGNHVVAPRGKSPVLFGLRSLDQGDAEAACKLLCEAKKTEPVSAWRVFRTNQASGDHLSDGLHLKVMDVEVDAVRKHVLVCTDGPSLRMYVEGGPVNALGRWLVPGDEVEVRGLVHPDGDLHVEQLRLVRAVARKQERPLCPECSTRMKSMGSGQGLRCPACKRRSEDVWVNVDPSPPVEGWIEPPLDARRHLARPLDWE